MQEPKRDQGGEIRRKAAECARSCEHHKADDVEQFPAKHLAELGEYRQERCDAEKIAEGDPAHAVESGVEYASQGRQRELDNARVDLAHEGADTGHAHDQPRIRAPAREERDRRRLRAMADEVAHTKSRRRAQIFGAHPTPPYARTGSGHMDGGPAQKSSTQRRNHTLDRGPGALMSKSPSLDRLFADGVLEKSIQHAVDGEANLITTLRVDFSHSLSRWRMSAICAKRTSRIDE